jgi:hypothetical protein
MATTTPNFGWSVPTSSDLVKNGATAIETLGDSIDASLVDLKGGTTGQVLAKATNTDMDFTWSTPASAGGMTLLQTFTANDTVQQYTLSSIPSTYKHILITGIGLQEAGSNDGSFAVRMNNDSGFNYANYRHTLSGTTVGEQVQYTSFMNSIGVLAQGGQGVDTLGQVEIWLYDYANTSTYKPMFLFGSSFNASSNKKCWSNGFWKSNTAVTRIDLIDLNSANFKAGTFRVYGVA